MILLYHKVDLESPTVWWVHVNAFYRQMLALRSYKVVYLDDYDTNDPDQVVITFDGIYEDVFHYALPILKRFGYPYELFIVGDTVGQDNAFDQQVEPPAMFASEAQLAEMVKAGARLQWHSRSHPDLTLPENQGRVEAELDVPPDLRKIDPKGFRWFGYPHGKHTDDLIAKTKVKFAGALSCVAGNDIDPYQLNRIIVKNDTNLAPSTVSLIIANYNYAAFAAEAIESVLRQIVLPDEILFMDDCSVDNSLAVAQRYEDRIRIESNKKNLGIVRNFNKAVSLTTGDYVCFLGADNRFRSDYVMRCRQALDSNRKAAIAYTNVALFGPRAEVVAQLAKAEPAPNHPGLYLWDFPPWDRSLVEPLQVSNFMHGSSMYRRAVFEEVGGYVQTDGPEDHNLFARMTKAGWDAVLVPEYLLEYRQHSNEQANTALNTAMELAYYRRMLTRQNQELDRLRAGRAGSITKQQLLAKGVDLLKQAADAGSVASGVTLADKVFNQFKEQGQLLHHYGQLLVHQGDLEGALHFLCVALKYDDELAAAHNDLASVLLAVGNQDQATHHLAEATRIEPDNLIYLENLGDLHLIAGNRELALRTYHDILARHPASNDLKFKIAQVYAAAHQHPEAVELCNALIEQDPGHQGAKQLLSELA